jgi:hypothetical protein
LQLGEQPCRQASGGFSTSQAEQQISGSALAAVCFVRLLILRAARKMIMTANRISFRASVFTRELDMINSPLSKRLIGAGELERPVGRKVN